MKLGKLGLLVFGTIGLTLFSIGVLTAPVSLAAPLVTGTSVTIEADLSAPDCQTKI